MEKLVKITIERQPDLSYQVELVEIKEDGKESALAERVSGSLPPSYKIYEDYYDWLEKYNKLDFVFRAKKEINSGELPQDAAVDSCKQAGDKLKYSFNEWLDDIGFHRIENTLRSELSKGENIRFIIHTKEESLWYLPWTEWDFFGAYKNAEVSFSPSEFRGGEKPVAATPRKYVRILTAVDEDSPKGDSPTPVAEVAEVAEVAPADQVAEVAPAKQVAEVADAVVPVAAIAQVAPATPNNGGNNSTAYSTGIDYKPDPQNLKHLRSVGARAEFLKQPTLREVRDRLWDKKWDILFLAIQNPKEESDSKSSNILTLSHLKNSLKTAIQNGLKIAIFNGRDGLDLARQIVTEFQMPLVIAMRFPVPNNFVQEFVDYFLLEYAYRKQPLYVAVRKARERIADNWRGKLPTIEWFPVILQNPARRPPTWADLYQHVSLKQVAIASVACTSLVILARFMGLLQPLELGAFDHLMRMRPAEELDKRLLVVEVTEKDIQEMKEYPISDRTIMRVLDTIMQYQPSAIGLDIYRDIPRAPGYAELATYLPNNQRVVTICSAGEPDNPDKIGVQPPPASPPDNVGFSDIAIDDDDIVRRHLFFMAPDSATPCLVPYALSAKLAFRYLQQTSKIQPGKTSKGYLKLGRVVFKPLENHAGFYHKLDVRLGQQVLLNYRSPRNFVEQVPLKAVLENKIGAYYIKDRIVLIGFSAPSAGDTLPTPYGAGRNQQMPEVLIHAQMVSQIISAALDRRPLLWFSPLWGDVLWIGFWSVVGGLVVWQWRSPLLQRLAGAAALGTLYGICLVVLSTQGGCLPLVPSALALVATGGTVLILIASPTQRSNLLNIRLAN